MKKSLRTLLTASILGILIAVGLNMITVKNVGIGPDGYEQYRGFPFQSCYQFIDLTQNNLSRCSYISVFGNTLVAFFVVYGVWGNIYFFREMLNKKG